MAQRSAPVIIASRSIQAYCASHELGNVAWNSDGQCLFTRRKGVHIMTPYLVSTLPPPASLADSNVKHELTTSVVNRARRQAAEMEEAGDGDENVEDEEKVDASGGKRVRRPKGGEVNWWTTTIEINEGDKEREEAYAWAETGDEYNGTINDRDIYVRSAVWSPSGLSELGGCYVAVLVSTGQISVYAPRSDPASQPWDEVADLTVIQKSLTVPDQDGAVSTQVMMEMRAVCMAWSKSVNQSQELGESGGILAIANRAGKVGIWTIDENRQFRRVHYIDISSTCWVNRVAWSDWKTTEDGTYDAELALSLSDGSVSTISVRQHVDQTRSSFSWEYEVGEKRQIDKGDERTITSMVWLDNLLIWTKSKSVHLYNQHRADGYSWIGVRTVKLERVGGWANANALGSCIGVQYHDRDSLIFTLSSLTRHLVVSLRSSPQLAPLADSLRLSLATRQCFYDYLYTTFYRRDPGRRTMKGDVDVTAVTNGAASVGSGWHIDTWVVEPIHLHNLNSSTESMRYVNFTVADLSGTLGQTETLRDSLARLLAKPSKASALAPLAAVMPYILRVLSSDDPQAHAQDLLQLCDIPSSDRDRDPVSPDSSSPSLRLIRHLWDDTVLDALRMRLVLVLWGLTHFKADFGAFKAAETRLTEAIKSCINGHLVVWAESAVTDLAVRHKIATRDRVFLENMAGQNGSVGAKISSALRDAGLDADVQLGGDSRAPAVADHCPACRDTLTTDSSGTARCAKRHEWVRCSVTGSLVVTPTYRVCNTCPAISLLPRRHSAPPIPVSPSGEARDWKRFVWPEGLKRDLMEELLEIATCCLMCGGRWSRSM